MLLRDSLATRFPPTDRLSLPRLRLAAPRIGEGGAVFLLPLIAFLALGGFLVFGAGSIMDDAWARVANAFYVLYSRDPHLAAMGFAWNPLPSLSVLPLLPFKHVWPALVSEGFAGNIVSALYMAGAVYQLWGLLRDQGLPRLARLALMSAFALHPMILHYGANGMSEAPFLFFLILGARYLARWRASDSSSALAVAAIALAGMYLTRYDGAVAFAVAAAWVAITTVRRSRGPWRVRARAAAADLLVLSMPFALAFIGWALASMVIVGSPFEVFSSAYGHFSQADVYARGVAAETGQGTEAGARFLAGQVLGLAPYLPLVLAGVLVAAAIRRDLGHLVLASLPLGILAFEMWAFLSGKTVGVLRYQIYAVPALVICAGILLQVTLASGRQLAQRLRHRFLPAAVAGALSTGLVAMVGASLLTGTATMLHPLLGKGEHFQVAGLVGADEAHPGERHLAAGRVAAFLDSLGLPDGSVIADAATSFPVILRSERPRQFVITPDRDFPAVLADPRAFDARYLVVPAPEDYGALDVLNRTHPDLYATGAGIGELVASYEPADVRARWRVYRLISE